MTDLVLLTGLGRNEDSYRKFKISAPSGCSSYIFNSSFLTDINDPSKTVENIDKLLGKHRLKKVNLVGHSLGGSLAIMYANTYPEKVKHLYLLDPATIRERRTILYFITNFLMNHSFHSGRVFVENLRALPVIVRNPVLYLKLFRYVRTIDLTKEASSIQVPTTILWGEKDHLIPVRHGEKLKSLIKESKLLILPKESHDWPLYKPELFWENVKYG